MKQILSTLCALALAVAPILAGKRIVGETVDAATKKTSPREILLDADRLRIDSGDNVVMFLSRGGNRVVLLDKKRNEYRVMDQAMMDSLGQQLAGMTAQMEAAMKGMPPAQRAQMEAMLKGKLGSTQIATPTGAAYTAKGAGTVNGFRCTNYDGVENGTKTEEICAASMADLKLTAADFAVMEKLREYMAGLAKALQSSPMAAMSDASLTKPGVNGLPVQTIFFEGGKEKSRETIKSVADATFSDADFSTGNAKQVAMPGIGNAKGKAK